jgi:hypothetical protein
MSEDSTPERDEITATEDRGVEHDETEARARRRERRFGFRGDTLLEAAKKELELTSLRLRDEERQARKRYDDDAERYRIAANATEDEIAELEAVLPEVSDDGR